MANLVQKLISDRALHNIITISNPDIENLKSLYALFDKYLDHMLFKIRTKSYGTK